MIGTTETGTRVLFCQGVYGYKGGRAVFSDAAPYGYTGDIGIYVELRVHDNDYLLEKTTIINSRRVSTYDVLDNMSWETEAERVREAIRVFDEMVKSHIDLQEALSPEA